MLRERDDTGKSQAQPPHWPVLSGGVDGRAHTTLPEGTMEEAWGLVSP